MQDMEHGAKTWSAVCSMARHLQSGNGQDAIAHGRIESYNTSLQTVDLSSSCSGQTHSDKHVLVMGMKTRSLDVLSQYSVFHL